MRLCLCGTINSHIYLVIRVAMTASPSSVSLYLQYIFFQRLLRKFLLDLSSPVSSLMPSHVSVVPLLLISHPGVFWACSYFWKSRSLPAFSSISLLLTATPRIYS